MVESLSNTNKKTQKKLKLSMTREQRVKNKLILKKWDLQTEKFSTTLSKLNHIRFEILASKIKPLKKSDQILKFIEKKITK